MANDNPNAECPTQPSVPGEGAYTAIKTLILTFESTDVPHLSIEVQALQAHLTSLTSKSGASDMTQWHLINLQDSEADVEAKLREFLPAGGKADHSTLYVIYYHGIAFRRGRGLLMDSHGNNWDVDTAPSLWNFIKPMEKCKPSAGVRWKKISPTIVEAQCDTLVILDWIDHFQLGIRAPNQANILRGEQYAYKSDFRKELVCTVASGPDVLAQVLSRGLSPHAGASMSVNALVRHLNKEMAPRGNGPQASRFSLAKNDRGKMILPYLGDDLDEEDPSDCTDSELSEYSGMEY
ncbi:hypothetical protein QBC39DRAFT_379641 [Podospora conica]|nr:hypothetical protein QBC39DRAFT_379641 [Schizothecium conicum]